MSQEMKDLMTQAIQSLDGKPKEFQKAAMDVLKGMTIGYDVANAAREEANEAKPEC